MATLLLKTPQHIIGFLSWWSYRVPIKIFRWFEELLSGIDNNLQLFANLKLWFSFEPLFGDYGWRGRAVGFLLRGVRLAVTLLVYAAALGVGIAALAAWFLTLPGALALIFGLV